MVKSSTVNRIDLSRLSGSKWTAVDVHNRDKHFLALPLAQDRARNPAARQIELKAVLSGRIRKVDYEELRDPSQWLRGWR